MGKKKKQGNSSRSIPKGSRVNPMKGSFKLYENRNRAIAAKKAEDSFKEVALILSELNDKWSRLDSRPEHLVQNRKYLRQLLARTRWAQSLMETVIKESLVAHPPVVPRETKSPAVPRDRKKEQQSSGSQSIFLRASGDTKKPGSWADGRHG